MSGSTDHSPRDKAESLDGTFDRIEALLEFPCDFPIKVIGHPQPGFEQAVIDIVLQHAPDFDPTQLRSTSSKRGRYLSLTLEVTVQNRAQLQSLYQALAAHESVRIVI